MDIPLGDRGKEGLAKGAEELELADVVDMQAHQILNLATIRPLQWPKAANIEWLEQVGGVWRHAERDDVVLLAMKLEFGRVVALVAVEDQQPVFALCPRCCVEVEVLDPIQANGISSPAIVGGCDTPVGWEVALGVPVGKVVLRGQDDKGGDSPAEGINPLDNYCLLAVARLG